MLELGVKKTLTRKPIVKNAQVPVTQAFLHLESRAYWAAVIGDTSDALYSDMRTSLTSGLNGACAEPAWRLSRAFLVGSFAASTEQCHAQYINSYGVVTCDSASRILGAASISQVLMWKNITSLKEALREGVEEDTVTWVWSSLKDTISIFRKSIRPLLRVCERQIHFLSQTNRFCWFEVTLRYCVGVGILLDALEKAKREDLVEELAGVRAEVEHEAFAVLKFGVDDAYRIPAQDALLASQVLNVFPNEPVEISFVTLYAFPHHVVTLAQTTCRVVVEKFCKGFLDMDVFKHLCNILVKSLEQLPRDFKGLESTRQDLETSIQLTMV